MIGHLRDVKAAIDACHAQPSALDVMALRAALNGTQEHASALVTLARGVGLIVDADQTTAQEAQDMRAGVELTAMWTEWLAQAQAELQAAPNGHAMTGADLMQQDLPEGQLRAVMNVAEAVRGLNQAVAILGARLERLHRRTSAELADEHSGYLSEVCRHFGHNV